MKRALLFFLLLGTIVQAQYHKGSFSLGSRSTLSLFNQQGLGTGVGGQFRVGLSDRVNTEWFADYLFVKSDQTSRKDYHIGWSVMYYPWLTDKKLQPYFLSGHCFDYSDLQKKGEVYTSHQDKWSSAIQAGAGTHLFLDDHSDLSLSTQYMIHLGKGHHPSVEKESHVLLTLSYNYQF